MDNFRFLYLEDIEARHQELLKEAETERLIRRYQSKHLRTSNGFRLILSNLGKVIVNWGLSLQKRYKGIPCARCTPSRSKNDAVLNIVPPPPGLPGTYTGLKEICGWLETLVGMNLKVEGVEIVQVEGDKVKLRVKTSSDLARRFNIAFLEYMEEHTIQAGKIKGYTVTISKRSTEKLQAAMANQAEKEKVLTAMENSLNAGAVDATMALFADDAMVKLLPTEMFPTGTFIGTEQVRFFIQHLISINFKSEFEILQVLGDIVITRSKTWQDTFIKLGIAPMEMIVVYHVEDGKIKSFINIFTDESLAKLKAAMAPK